ncbi:hypothetical protein E1189_00655, partial [Sansalvadorimonas verongulae]|nr:hypothetical protein [Sansalvadorimonas verongulae]
MTGEFVDGFPLPFNSDINAWEIHCRKVVKQEIEDVYEAASILPGDLDYDGPAPAIEVLSQNGKGAVCRGKQNTTCPCGATFASASLLKSHRRISSDAQCKGKQNTTCPCGITFDSVSLLHSHRQGSQDTRCKGKQNTTCLCGVTFNSASRLKSHRRGSRDARCRGKRNT